MKRSVLAALAALLPALPAAAQDIAAAEVVDRDGKALGSVQLRATASGTTLVTVALNGLPEGAHGIHLHETGDCSADDFSSAGGHIAGDAEHGILVEGRPHPGDLPNVIVQADGVVNAEFFNPGLDISEMIHDDDGAAFIVHSGPDDYQSQPAGDAGDRIACGEFVRQAE